MNWNLHHFSVPKILMPLALLRILQWLFTLRLSRNLTLVAAQIIALIFDLHALLDKAETVNYWYGPHP
jgi:hypothetical protein